MASASSSVVWRELFDRIALLVKYASIIHCVQYYGFEFTLCVGPSMLPTFNSIGDIIIIEHPSVMLGSVKRVKRARERGKEKAAVIV